jgi:AcrR family transcriptional regulator
MNQITFGSLSAVARVRRPTQRALAKQRTREKILSAAKNLFTARGYEGATIRDIASGAGMSTGAVFASFTDKQDLFTEIVGAEHQALVGEMRAAGEDKTALEAIQAMFEAAAERHLGDLALFQATMSALWSPALGGPLRTKFARTPVTELIVQRLKAAAAAGELRASVDADLVAELIWDGYVSTIRRAALEDLKLAEVKQRVAEQIRLIFAGARQA